MAEACDWSNEWQAACVGGGSSVLEKSAGREEEKISDFMKLLDYSCEYCTDFARQTCGTGYVCADCVENWSILLSYIRLQ